jgi:transcriptional/translational regulatory protein YebC/TACO1
MIPKNTIQVEGAGVKTLLKLLDVLEEHDDVQNVFSNADIDEKEMEALA